MEVTFDGENCTYEGPAEVPVGDVQLVYHNQSTAGGTVFMDFFRIVEGRTVQDVLDYIAADNAPGAPSWTWRVYLADFVPTESSTDQVTRTVQHGLHGFVCGTNSPYVLFYGGELTVVP